MKIDNENISLLSNLTFKTVSYRKNFDMISDDDNIITECDGVVSELRIAQKKSPITIGEYGFSIWNIELGKSLGINLNKLLKAYTIEDSYIELYGAVKNKQIDITQYKRVVIIHNFILRADYRKKEITEEFVEMIYRDYYDKDVAIFALVKPFQNNPVDSDFYFKHKSILVKGNIIDGGDNKISAVEYYSLNDLCAKSDCEYNEYKLFSVASKCGFIRIDESHLFQFVPDKIIERMMLKTKKIKNLNI
jgi:hypothetical protein